MRLMLAILLRALAGPAAPELLHAQASKEGKEMPEATAPRPELSVKEQREELLDRLFGRLKTAKNQQEAQVIEQSIWRIWTPWRRR